ncbi:WLM-domain-containing protein [Coprinellus micaceus]|uniref:WLM-domain-containing protein n=1 Tax=Coprinellus micaceus TaxID=71717 RepID=A0A4Y7TGT9_COPMI|nr:WLM-domain-containing protein [Coprinellus micaceus]
MVHLRLNETESNPNPFINFITALPSLEDIQEESRQLLRALAAQVKPVMKSHGFSVNSFEEYEYNAVFAGRNWNNGETVELVLRRPGGEFYPASWLMSTLCHELAHIKHMNHGPAFQALWKQLRLEVRHLQERGYYGDGYWSSGQRLADSARIPGDGIEAGDFPEFMCGGAQTRARPTARRRRTGVSRGPRKETVPSLHTGRQTAKKRKAGGRVTSKYAFAGEGNALVGDSEEGSKGKRAASNRAREERALAAERRIQALLGGEPIQDTHWGQSTQWCLLASSSTGDQAGDGSEDEFEDVKETDADRRQTLLSSKSEDDDIELLGAGKSWQMFLDDFDFTRSPRTDSKGAGKGKEAAVASGSKDLGTIDISSEDEEGRDGCDIPRTSGSMSTVGSTGVPSSQRKGGTRGSDGGKASEKSRGPSLNTGALGLGKLVQTEIDFRKKESLGMAPVKGGGRTLGSAPRRPSSPPTASQWTCELCTLINKAQDSTCAVCETPRGQANVHGQ